MHCHTGDQATLLRLTGCVDATSDAVSGRSRVCAPLDVSTQSVSGRCR